MWSLEGAKAPDRRGSVAVAAILTFLVARSSQAAEPGYEISVGVAESDNVARVATDAKSDTILTEGLALSWHDLSPRLEADVDGDVDYLQYLKHTVNNEVIGNFLGQARFALAPDILFWHASDNFGQGLIDPLAADNPENRENINYFSTGPELMLPVGATTFVDMKANYGRVSYQTSPLDSQRVDGSVALIRKISQDSSVSVNVRDQRVDYSDDVTNPDYSRQDAFLHYDMKNTRTTFDADLGYSRLRDPLSPSNGVLARFDVSRKVSPSSTVALSLGHEYSDASSAFLLEQTLGGANLNTQTAQQQAGTPFTSNYASLSWNYQRVRTGFGISADYFKDTYPAPSTLNDNREQLSAHISRKLGPTLQVSLQEQYFRQEFQEIVGNSTQITTGLQLNWQASEHLTLVFDAERAYRHSDLADTNFAEDRVWVRIAYGRQAQLPAGPVTPPLPGERLKSM
jgi:hypothetical protein